MDKDIKYFDRLTMQVVDGYSSGYDPKIPPTAGDTMNADKIVIHNIFIFIKLNVDIFDESQPHFPLTLSSLRNPGQDVLGRDGVCSTRSSDLSTIF